MLMKETNEDLSEWTDTPRSWTRRLHTVTMSVLPKLTYRLNMIPTKTSVGFFCSYGHTGSKIYREKQRN